MKRPMNFRQWWDEVGTTNVEKVAANIGSSMAYFRRMKYGDRKPSIEYAEKIISAAKRVTPGFEPDLRLLLKGVPKAERLPGAPSPEFVAAQRKRRQARAGAQR